MAKKYIESNALEYTNLKAIYGYTCVIRGEDEQSYFIKEFRHSSDNILWSDYKELNNKNLSKIQIYDKLYIQYRFTPVGNAINLTVDSITLDVDYKDVESSIPECHWNMVNTNRYLQHLSFVTNTENKNIFNPYDTGYAGTLYRQLSTMVNNIFGFCVLYFKTEVNAGSRDVVLKEYSIEHVIDKQNIKILIPDNQLPTKELQFNSLMIDYPVQFEIHIVKDEFYKIFGADSHPDPHDYLFFQNPMNKMYMVDAVSEPDDFMYTSSYWRVSLVPYQEISSLEYEDDLQEDTETLIFSSEGKFEEKLKDEFADVRKDNQLNNMGDWQEGQDFLRAGLDPNLRIVDESIYNEWTIVSKQHYDLSTIERNLVANEYKYSDGFTQNDERMISFFFRPNNTKTNVSDNIILSGIGNGETGVMLKLKTWNKSIAVGNYFKISRTSNLNGFRKITKINKGNLTVEVEGEYNTNSKLLSCAKAVCYEANTYFKINDDISISQTNNQIIMKIGSSEHSYEFDDFTGFENKWYAVIVGLYRGLSNVWLYEVSGSEIKDNKKSSIKFIGKASSDIGKYEISDDSRYQIISCDACLTNFRLWSKLCEEDKHKLILSQYVIDDSHNAIIVDNAQNEILLNNKWS